MSTTSNVDNTMIEGLWKNRALENVRPGHWFLGTYAEEDGTEVQLWAQVTICMNITRITTGEKLVRILGRDTTGEPVELMQLRGHAVRTLTAAQATKAGLAVPA